MQWYQTSLAKLAATNCQHVCIKITILNLEILSFADTQTRDTQQTKQAVVDPGQQGSVIYSIGFQTPKNTPLKVK